jgi:hypothetical protein
MRRSLGVLNIVGLFCGLVGGLLLAFSLTLKASNYQLVETSEHQVVICHNDKLVSAGWGGSLVGGQPCPQGVGPKVAPVIQAEKPAYVPWGLALVWL